MDENLTVVNLIGISFIDRYIWGSFPSQSKIIPRHFLPVSMLSREISTATQHFLKDQNRKEISSMPIFIEEQTAILPHTRIFVPVRLSASGLFGNEPESLGVDIPMLHCTHSILKPIQTHVFLVIIFKFSAKSRR